MLHLPSNLLTSVVEDRDGVLLPFPRDPPVTWERSSGCICLSFTNIYSSLSVNSFLRNCDAAVVFFFYLKEKPVR